MSTREHKRAVVFGRVKAGGISLHDAATLLDLSYRQTKRLARRYRARGRKGLVHGNVGRRSNRAHPRAARDQVVALIKTHYGGPTRGLGQRFGPTLAAEHLWADHGVVIPIPTLRRWMLAEHLWSPQRRRTRAHHRRDRRAHFGELLQLDGSFHDWFEGRGPRGCVMTLIDDATGTQLARMGKEETLWAAVGVLRAWIAAHGVPQALYVDAKNLFVRPPTVNELAAGRAPVTQFGRICARLGIELIIARSPQAKGRVERAHGTNQDRLIKKMRLAGIATYEAANIFLDTRYCPAHNARFAVRPSDPVDFHTAWDRKLVPADVWCRDEVRTLGNDWVVRYQNRGLHVLATREARRYTTPRGRLVVRETEDGTIRVIARSATGTEHVLAWEPISVARGATPSRYQAPTPKTPPPPPALPAGYTRAGVPLSARQMAVRAKWSREDSAAVKASQARHLSSRSRTTGGPSP